MGLLKVRLEGVVGGAEGVPRWVFWPLPTPRPTRVLQGPATHPVLGLALLQHLGRGASEQGLDGGDPGPPGDLKAHLQLRVCPSQSEDKVKAIANLYGPLMALNHMVQQDYFPKALAPLLQAFMTK